MPVLKIDDFGKKKPQRSELGFSVEMSVTGLPGTSYHLDTGVFLVLLYRHDNQHLTFCWMLETAPRDMGSL